MIIAGPGLLMVSTDLHGNWSDFARLRRRFLALNARTPGQVQWALLGDLVHGPNAQARRRRPDLYDYDDASQAIVMAVDTLQRAHPGRVHLLLGNHDWAQIGGPPTAKFYPDEAQALADTLEPAQHQAMIDVLYAAKLAAATPCGVLLTHGAPGAPLASLRALDAIDLRAPTAEARVQIANVCSYYGQSDETIAALLARLSLETKLKLAVVVHGHDRDEAGFFTEGSRQACPVIFGAPDGHKRYLELDLDAHYGSAQDLARRALRHVYPDLAQEQP